MANEVISAKPRQKVVAATGGSLGGGAIAVVLLWMLKGALEKAGIAMPDNVTEAVTVLITGFTTFLAGYFMPPGADEAVMRAPDGGLKSAITVTAN